MKVIFDKLSLGSDSKFVSLPAYPARKPRLLCTSDDIRNKLKLSNALIEG
jgi:hypothetical protein